MKCIENSAICDIGRVLITKLGKSTLETRKNHFVNLKKH